MTKVFNVYIDTDALLFKSCASSEHDIVWDDETGLHIAFSYENECIAQFNAYMFELESYLLKTFGSFKYRYIHCLSGVKNFRKYVDETYKSNRKTKRKPLAYFNLKEWLKGRTANDNFLEVNGLEGDDIMAIQATKDRNNKVLCCIVTNDKDLKQVHDVPIVNPFDNSMEVYSERESKVWMYTQVLTGDTTDGYSGCKGIGKIKAEKILKDTPDENLEEVCKQTYITQGMTEDDYYRTLKLARMVTDIRIITEDYKIDLNSL